MVKARLTRLSPLSLHLCLGVAAALPTSALRAETLDLTTQEAAKEGGKQVSPALELSATNIESQWLGANTENPAATRRAPPPWAAKARRNCARSPSR